jgi:hypothetical protein
MAKRKGKPISFNAMVKFFMQAYGIPTKKDVEKLMNRMDRIESLIRSTALNRSPGRISNKAKAVAQGTKKPAALTASDTVLNIIKRSKNGIGFSDIQTKTGFGEKKLRNIIFRLNKLEKIKRKDRGTYVAA